jgi:glycerol dehydrogenase-like iron-containing ADH family enzyme
MKKQEMRKYMDEALNLIKDMQKNKESSIFKSSTDRFREMPKELSEKPKFMIGVGAGGLTDRERELSTM